MSSANLIRPFARALRTPIARPATFAAFSTKTVAPVTQSINAKVQAKAPVAKKNVPAALPMDKMVWQSFGSVGIGR